MQIDKCKGLDQPMMEQFSKIAQRYISQSFICQAYMLQILSIKEQGNKQGQRPGRRRGLRMHGGRVGRKNSRRGQDCRHVSDEIRATYGACSQSRP